MALVMNTMDARSCYRDALRILYIFTAGASHLPEPHESGAIAMFRGEARLYAFDFWMRYPDYLADELLTLFEQTRDYRYIAAAEAIFTDDEPDIRRFPMIRYRFGAYERLDDTLALLRSRDLVRITGTKDGSRVLVTDFLIMPRAYKLAQDIVDDYFNLIWYSNRASLIAELAGDRGGNALKQRQYEQAEYAETQMGGIIPPITDRVRARLDVLKASRQVSSI
jgi:hypothetical protein